MKSLKYLIISFFLFVSLHSNAQSEDIAIETNWDAFKYDVGSIWGGIKYTYTRPFHWQKKDFMILGGLVGTSAVLYSFDEESRDFFSRQEKDFPKILDDFGWYFGSPQNHYMLSGGIYGVGLFTKNEKLRRLGVLLITSSTAAGFIQTVSKTAFGRERPYRDEFEGSKSGFHFMSSEAHQHSFPSGHAILSTITAHAIAKQFKSIWAKTFIYSLGAIAPVQRLTSGSHWLTDVTVGIVLGVVTVEAVDKYLDKRYDSKYNDRRKDKKVSWNVSFTGNTLGLIGTF